VAGVAGAVEVMVGVDMAAGVTAVTEDMVAMADMDAAAEAGEEVTAADLVGGGAGGTIPCIIGTFQSAI
jgi:hypothetical protein